MKRTVLSLFYVLAMLFAQQTALTHASWHVPGRAPAQEQQSHQGKVSFHSALCDFHGSFAQVLGGAHGSVVHCNDRDVIAHSAVEHARAHPALKLPAPRSRGPPAVLS
jgi:hypothetical protein